MIALDERTINIIVLALSFIFIFFIIKVIFNIIRWFFQTVWYLLTGKKKREDPLQSDDWLIRAQAKQEIRFRNAAPPLSANKKSKKRRKNKEQTDDSKKTENPNSNQFDHNPDWKWDENAQLWRHKSQWGNIEGKESISTNTEESKITEPEEIIDYAHAYQAQQLFSRNEWQNYKILREIADAKGYVICPKVRLLDIVKPRNGEKKYKTLMYKIQSKHVDFVLCDQNMHIKAIIELDDSTHDTEKGKERDAFVNTVLKGVGYKVIHTRYINRDILDSI